MEAKPDKSQQRSVLIFGQDVLLLETRCLVLESAGFAASATTELDRAEHLLADQRVSILILCHTLPSEHCHRILATAREQRPTLKVLVLSGNEAECAAHEGDAELQGLATARHLIHAVQAIAASELDAEPA